MADVVEAFDWTPSQEIIERANVTAVARQLKLPGYLALHRWSVEHRDDYWRAAIERLGIKFRRPFERIVDDADVTQPRWLPGARLNIVDSCFNASDASPAIVTGAADGSLRTVTVDELRRNAARVANGLVSLGIRPGDAVAILMPMNADAVAAYLGIVAAGAAVVSIADSFAPAEIATRLRISDAELMITQDQVRWGGKTLPLYEKALAAAAPRCIVFGNGVALRDGDISAALFEAASDEFVSVERNPGDPINILFSSGTTGDPKAIPWDHTTPIKCAADAHFHHDIHPGDVICWPTSLGWMMGPWLVFAALMNRATIALYEEAPVHAGFGRFVQDAKVTLLGLVPSLVRAWRHSRCMEGLDWSAIRAFSSTGECSNADDMRYLMSLAGNRPVIEYCGGTEIGGAYVTSTLVQPSIASTFTTAALGLDLVLLDDEGKPGDKGEVYLRGPSIGLSTRLLNRDHTATYFADAPLDADGKPLRRHGDELERLSDGRYRVAGRCDDTMNLGGIKVGCVEIERAVNTLPTVHETAAVAVSPAGGGPSQLVIFTVLKPGATADSAGLREQMQTAIRTGLNPLFRVSEVRIVDSLPRTASNKVMRRELRATLVKTTA